MQQTLVRVAVVIPTYNHASFVGEAVRSVLAQTRAADAIVVVDDGSTDDSARVLAGFEDQVTVIRQQNQGVSAARNAGVSATSSEVVAFLDADDVWEPAKLERQLERLDAEPDAALVHVGLTTIDAEGRELGAEDHGLEGWVANDLLAFRRPVVLGGGSGFVVRRAALEGIGGFDERLSTSADWDVFYRLARRHRVAFVPERLLRYRLHGSNMHGNVRVMERDMRLAFRKAFAEPDAPRHLRRPAYARLHLVLSGSYAGRGDRLAAVRHGLTAVALAPSNLVHVLATPVRRRRPAGGGS